MTLGAGGALLSPAAGRRRLPRRRAARAAAARRRDRPRGLGHLHHRDGGRRPRRGRAGVGAADDRARLRIALVLPCCRRSRSPARSAPPSGRRRRSPPRPRAPLLAVRRTDVAPGSRAAFGPLSWSVVRADAERSIAAILDAAVQVLAARPDAGMGEIAKAAGVARQTVYAHFTLARGAAERGRRASAGARRWRRSTRREPERGDARRGARSAWRRRGGARSPATPACSRRWRPPCPRASDVHAFHGPVLARVAGARAARRLRRARPAWLAVRLPGADARRGRGGRGGAHDRRRRPVRRCGSRSRACSA